MSRMRPLAHLVVLASLFGAVMAAGCNGKRPGTGPDPDPDPRGKYDAGPPVDPEVCDQHRAKVEAIYRAEQEPVEEDERALVEQELVDNVEMMLIDCRKDARRFAPCLENAVSVKQMERDCLIPLDDEGTEGRDFTKR